MSRVFITGSSDGLGLLSAKALITQGHEVVLHARNEKRKNDAIKSSPGAFTVLTGDLSKMEEIKKLAADANALGTFDAIIHNAGVYQASARDILMVNTIAPYVLTSLIEKPKRLVYLSSGMHMHGTFKPGDFQTGGSSISYSDSKLYVLMLCMAVARKWRGVYANTVNPGWVPTKMGGRGAPDDLQKGYETQVWLAVSDDQNAKVTGHYFFHKKEKYHKPEADNAELQDQFLNVCKTLTGVNFPE